jgi:hypothetical protein
MYFAKESRADGMWHFQLWKKVWSEEMQTHDSYLLAEKNFIFRGNGIKWISKLMLNILISENQFEIRKKNAR